EVRCRRGREALIVVRSAVGKGADAERLFGGVLAVGALPGDQFVIGLFERPGQCLAGAGEEGIRLRLVEFLLFDQSAEVGLQVGPDGAVVAALVERRAGNDPRRLVDDRVERETRWTDALGCRAPREVDQLAQGAARLADA